MGNREKVKLVLIVLIFCLITFNCGLLCCDAIARNNAEKSKDMSNINDTLSLFDNNDTSNQSNPIDNYYLPKYGDNSVSYELSQIGDEHYTAWKNEFENVVSLLKEKYDFHEDKDYFDDYISKYNELTTIMAEIENLNWTDTTVEPKERTQTTQAPIACITSMIDIYRQGCMNLMKVYETSSKDKIIHYEYIFDKSNI